MSLDKKKHDFITRQSRLQDNIVEAIQTHCDAMLEGLEDEDELNASSPAQQPHECVQNLISYLKSTFDMIPSSSHPGSVSVHYLSSYRSVLPEDPY